MFSLTEPIEIKEPSPQQGSLHVLRALPLLALVAVALSLCPLLPLGRLRLTLYLLLSGVPLLMLIGRRWPVGALLLALAPASLAVWSVTTSLLYLLPVPRPHPWIPVTLAWTPAALAWAACICWRKRRLIISAGSVDALALLAGIVVAGGMLIFSSLNGPRPDGTFKASVAATGDVFYMFSFVEISAVSQSLPHEGPFLPHSLNSYPVCMHAGLGALSRQSKGPAPVSLWPILPLLVFGSGLIVFIMSQRATSTRRRGWQWSLVAIVAFFLGTRIDLFILPQTQGMAFPLLFLFLYTLGPGPLRRLPIARAVAAMGLLVLVCLSHTLSGVAAMAFFVQSLLIWKPRRARWGRMAAACACLLICVVITLVVSRRPVAPLQMKGINPVTFENLLLSWKSWSVPFGIACAVALSVKMQRIKWVAPALLTVLGLGYGPTMLGAAIPSTGYFSVFNAVRFFHFAMIGLLPAFLSFPALPGCLLILSLVPILPKVKDVGYIYTAPPATISTPLQSAYQFIREHTPLSARAISEDKFHATAPFTGHPAFEHYDINGYSVGMVDEREYDRKVAMAIRLFSRNTAPARREQILKSLNLNQVILLRQPQESPGAFEARARNFLPARVGKVIFENAGTAVLGVPLPNHDSAGYIR